MLEFARFESGIDKIMNSLLKAQTVMILLGVGIAYFFLSSFDALSAAYGGGISLFSTLILSSRATRAIKSASEGDRRAMSMLYIGVIQRYAFVLLGLIIGLAVLKLSVKPLLAVFAISQLAFFIPWLGNE